MPATEPSHLKAILGPTNTGKTHYAVERLLAHRSGLIGLPLRLLAREVYQRMAGRAGADQVALVTGEERIVPARARYWVATVEAMPTQLPVECLAVDEIQIATHPDRGHVFTDRMLNARGSHETLLLGAGTMGPVIRRLLPSAEIVSRPRLSELTYTGSKKLTRQPRRAAIVAFSAAEVYAIAELIRRQRGGAAVVMGALSPRTRNAQVELFESGDVDFLVATDAIGMGLNLAIDHVAFAADQKFDGHQWRALTPAEIGQIAGRAGRHASDGTFGTTSGLQEWDEETVEQLETHQFEPVRTLQWRSGTLDFASLEALAASLDVTPEDPALTRVPTVTDQLALGYLMRHDNAALATGDEAVRLAWECCQIPDYRELSPTLHGEIVASVFGDLRRHGVLDEDWIAEQVRFCDNISGDIDTLSNRIKQIRTWTFVANRRDWLKDPQHWRQTTRDIEDRLSDALHERLTQRFVDRRTSLLMRHLREGAVSEPEINDKGEVSLGGQLIGVIEGFRFTLARSDDQDASRNLAAAAGAAIAPEILRRAERFADAPNDEMVLTADGFVRWRGGVVAELAEGNELMAPRAVLLADETLTGPHLERVQDRLSLWLRHTINTALEPLMVLRDPPELDGPARGVAFQVAEWFGVLPRQLVADQVKGLDQEVRGRMRKLGIKFGAYHIFVPALLKPAPRELALVLWALKNGGVRQEGVADLPRLILSGRTSVEVDPAIDPSLYEIAGFKVAGKRAVRVDILERLADIIRPLVAFDLARADGEAPEGAAEGNAFRVTVEMTSLLGCAGEEFSSILKSLGYRVKRTPIERPEGADAGAGSPAPATPAPDGAGQAEETPAEAGEAEAAPAEAGEAEAAPAEGGEAEEAPAEAGEAPTADPAATETAETEIAETAATKTPQDGAAAAPAEPARQETEAPRPEDGEAAPAEAAPPRPEAEASQAAASAAPAAPVSDGEDAPDEPLFDEVWSPSPRRARHQRPRKPQSEEAGPAKRRAAHRGGDQDQGAKKPGKGKPRRAAPRPDGDARPPKKRRDEIDPDSPFAALAALKEPPATRK